MDQLDPHAGASGFGGTGSTQLDVGVRDIPTRHLVYENAKLIIFFFPCGGIVSLSNALQVLVGVASL